MKHVRARAAEAMHTADLDRVQAEFAACCTLADLMSWCARQSPRAHVQAIVTQDEYTHDVILSFGDVFLSFDTT